MIDIFIPGFGQVVLKYFVSDYTGTLSIDGFLINGIKSKIMELSKILEIHILTADTFSKAKEQLENLPVKLVVLKGKRLDIQKRNYIKKLGTENVFACGNGKNDRLMLKFAKISAAVCINEGCAIDSVKNSKIICKSPIDAMDLILNPKRLIATLRF
ncbi:MAG: HAD family hydrolase [Exilispira sp.]